MAGRSLFLGVDVGTQGTKGLVVDNDGQVIARARQEYGLIEGLPPAAAEQHPETWVDAVRGVAAQLRRPTRDWSVYTGD